MYFTFLGESVLCETCGNKLATKQSTTFGLRKHIQTQHRKLLNKPSALDNSVSLMTKEEGFVICSDHKLNIALQKTAMGTQELKEAFHKSSSLTTRLHKSTAFSASLKDACSTLDVNYLKIPPSVTTRWKSHYDTLHAMLRLKVPLIYLRETHLHPYR